jgi:L-alanine-DL-glutamate epimerase-like enolase superfamily enzyme
MNIQKIEALPISLPVVPFEDAYGSYDRLNYVIVKIYLENGVIGVGEGSPIDPSFYGETQESIVTTIQKWIGPSIIGQNALNIERIESLIDHRVNGNSCAKAAVDIALYDAIGKSLNQPVYALLGGASRDKVAVGLELGITQPEDMPRVVSRILELKPKVIKIHVGEIPRKDVLAIKALHDNVGDQAVIRADSNGAYTLAEAIQVIRKVDHCELEYFEQPVPRQNLDGLNQIRRSVQTPIAVDESVWTPQDAMEVCKKEAADVLNIKVTRVGGLNRAKKIADIVDSAFLKTHIGAEFEFGVGMAAKVHLGLALGNATCAATGEFTEIVELKDNIVKQQYPLIDGYLQPSGKPGLGVELDEAKMRLYASKLS